MGSLHSLVNAALVAPLLKFDLPRQRQHRRAQRAADGVVQDVPIGPISLQSVADGLRQALKGLRLSPQDAARYASLVDLCEKSQAEALGRRSLHTHVLYRTWQWRITYLLKHVMLSLDLKSCANFYGVLRKAMTVVLPDLWSATFFVDVGVSTSAKASNLVCAPFNVARWVFASSATAATTGAGTQISDVHRMR